MFLKVEISAGTFRPPPLPDRVKAKLFSEVPVICKSGLLSLKLLILLRSLNFVYFELHDIFKNKECQSILSILEVTSTKHSVKNPQNMRKTNRIIEVFKRLTVYTG